MNKSLLLSLGLLAVAGSANAADPYIRFPAVRGDTVVFTAEGDLWKAGIAGGAAQRLTTHAGSESQAAISPDGQWLAFIASYEGAPEAYVMPLAGGLPKRLTFANENARVLGWTAKGEVLVALPARTGPRNRWEVSALQPDTLARRAFPVADANDAVLDDDGKTLYFTRLGLFMTGDNVRRYRGGAAAQLWRYDVDGGGEARQVFSGEAGNFKRPMWWKGRLYFISDRDGADNIWSSNADGGDLRAHTRHKDWDVRNASLGEGRIVYQLGADIHVLELAGGATQPLKVSLLSDFDQQRTRQVRSPLEVLTNTALSAREERVVLTARGRVSIAGTGSLRRVEIAIPEGARARDAVFSHDEKFVYAIVDTTGENEIWKFAADGSGKGERLTTDGNNHRWAIYPSPDGRWLAHNDKKGRMWLLDLATRKNTLVDDAGKAVGIDQHDPAVWSPDSRYLAFVRSDSDAQRDQVALYAVDGKQLAFVTGDRYPSEAPVFSPDGRWLYFLSARNFALANGSPWGDRNMGPVFDKRVGVYALALQPGNRFPFKPDDELSKAGVKPAETPEEKAAEKAVEKAAEKSAEKIADSRADRAAGGAAAQGAGARPGAPPKPALPAIVFAGLSERIYEVPLAAGNYRDLAVDDKRLYFLERDGNDGRSTLKTLAIARNNPQPETFVAGIRNFELSGDRKRVYYRTFAANGPGDMMIVDAGAKLPSDTSKAKVRVEDWTFVSNPRLEWKQMFNDAWRMHRDFLYDAKMRGVDWNLVRSKYTPLVERVTERAELNDILGMMVAEVGALHSQVAPGDIRRPAPEGTPASLGAVLERTAKGYRVEHVYRTEPELPNARAPLALPDVDVREGDTITAVNGKPVLEARDISDLLLNQADKQVLLNVSTAKGAQRSVIVTPVPLARHALLRYGDWEQGLARQVDEASKGRIGYLHLRAMGPNDIATFAREFYANIQRDGLIIDVRRNQGGNIDSWIIEKLLRKAWAYWAPPSGRTYANMQNTFRGHLVVLVDELTYSDGETFAAGIKALGLAPLVGKRSAGAGVWLSDRNRLSDNGMVRVAENGQFSEADGQWLIEGVGVAPDVEVDNLPHAVYTGRDRQLEVAIEMLQKKLKEQPVKPLQPQAIPALK